MKKLIAPALLLLALGALGKLPFRAADVAELLPVRTVLIGRDGTEYTVDVGAGVRGVGKTIDDALDALRERVSGTVFFGTAEQVVLTEKAADALPAVLDEPAFRPAAGIYLTPEEDLDPEAAADYLAAHSSNLTLMRLKARLLAGETTPLPILRKAGGGYTVCEN